MMLGLSTKPPLGDVNATYSGGEGPPMGRMIMVQVAFGAVTKLNLAPR